VIAETQPRVGAGAHRRPRALEMLDLGHNALTALPDALGALPSLRVPVPEPQPAHGGARVRSRACAPALPQRHEQPAHRAPDAIGDMHGLVELRLYGNQLRTLPDAIGGLAALQELHLSDNGMTGPARGDRGLRALTHLDLRNNALAALPAEVRDLESLAFLDLRANRLTAVPAASRRCRACASWTCAGTSSTRPAPWREEMARRGCTVYAVLSRGGTHASLGGGTHGPPGWASRPPLGPPSRDRRRQRAAAPRSTDG
jgi:Leucine-rich repeat (LRR) protein